MKLKTILFLLSLPILAFSQRNTSIDFITGIDYSYRSLSGNSIIEEIRSGETGKMNWRVGFNYNKRISEHLYIKAGLRFASVGYHGENRNLRFGNEQDGTGTWIPDPSLATELQVTYDYWFIEIPVVGRYEFNNRKISPFVEFGIAPSYYLTTRIHQVTNLEQETNFQRGFGNSDYNKIHVVGVLAIGLNYTPNENFQFFAQPTFRYHFSTLVNTPLKEHLYNIGLELGARKFFH